MHAAGLDGEEDLHCRSDIKLGVINMSIVTSMLLSSISHGPLQREKSYLFTPDKQNLHMKREHAMRSLTDLVFTVQQSTASQWLVCGRMS